MLGYVGYVERNILCQRNIFILRIVENIIRIITLEDIVNIAGVLSIT
jgi:hypothetical protein